MGNFTTKINDIKISTRGQGNSICALELNTDKTQQTTLYAKVIINTDTINISKEITLLGRFWGTYSIPAISIDGNILPAINNKEFGPGYPILPILPQQLLLHHTIFRSIQQNCQEMTLIIGNMTAIILLNSVFHTQPQ